MGRGKKDKEREKNRIHLLAKSEEGLLMIL